MTYPWKTVWIIGGSTGLGATAAKILAEDGIQVTVSARSKNALDGLSQHSDNIHALPLDITDRGAVEECVNRFVSTHGTLPDLIILNAAIYTPMSVDNFDPSAIQDMMQVNYQGIVHCIAALLPYRDHVSRTTIAVVTSPSGWRGLPGGVGYGPTKAALINLVEGLKPELDHSNFDIRLVNPGFIQTRLTDKNRFKMPQLMTADDAAKRMLVGISRGKFDTAFPQPFIGFLRLLSLLPYRLYFWLAGKIL